MSLVLNGSGIVSSNIVDGTIVNADVADLAASKLTGTVADARLGTVSASKLTGALPAISGASLTNLPASGAPGILVTQYTAGSGTFTCPGTGIFYVNGVGGGGNGSGGGNTPGGSGASGASVFRRKVTATPGSTVNYSVGTNASTTVGSLTLNKGGNAVNWSAAASGGTVSGGSGGIAQSGRAGAHYNDCGNCIKPGAVGVTLSFTTNDVVFGSGGNGCYSSGCTGGAAGYLEVFSG